MSPCDVAGQGSRQDTGDPPQAIIPRGVARDSIAHFGRSHSKGRAVRGLVHA
jgi:hypothetical protein